MKTYQGYKNTPPQKKPKIMSKKWKPRDSIQQRTGFVCPADLWVSNIDQMAVTIS